MRKGEGFNVLYSRPQLVRLVTADVGHRHQEKLVNGRATTEAPSGVNENTIVPIAETGVNIISVDDPMHSIRALDISHDVKGHQAERVSHDQALLGRRLLKQTRVPRSWPGGDDVIIASMRSSVEQDHADMRKAFAHVGTWIFDLDDTLYPRSIGLHEQLRARVVAFIARHMQVEHAAAEAIHRDYYERFGSTLQGMIELHGIAPEDFLDFIHDVDLSALVPNEALIGAIGDLPGRRVVFSNGSRGHADAALNAMGLGGLFDVIACIEDSGFVGKPHLSAFKKLLLAHGIEPTTSAMFEDRLNNLVVPHALGMKTVLVVDPVLHVDQLSGVDLANHVDFIISDLAAFFFEIAIQV